LNFLAAHDLIFASGSKGICFHWLIVNSNSIIMILYQKVMYKTLGRIRISSIVRMLSKVSTEVGEILPKQDSYRHVRSFAKRLFH
jgi:hypothetical protein